MNPEKPIRIDTRSHIGEVIATALDYSMKRSAVLTRYLVDGHRPVDDD